MKKEHYDVVVLGVGGMGSATLYTLAKRGLKVCGIEQFGVAHDKGSSHGETRMIRKAYFEHPDYMPLLDRTYELWGELEGECGQELFVKNGLLLAGAPDAEVIKGLDLCYQTHDLPHDKLTLEEAKQRFPQFHFRDDFVVYFDPIAGFLHVEKCIEAPVKLALKLGAALHTNEKVLNWQADGSSVKVKTDRREIFAEKLILTAGAWSKRELQKMGVDLEVWRKVVIWYTSPDLSQFTPEACPSFYVELDYGGFYGFAAMNELGIKVGEHAAAEICDPNRVNREMAPHDEPPLLKLIRDTFPAFQPTRQKFAVCMYSVTADHHFILDQHPENENVVIAAGFSGHGFKFTPVVGEILSDLAVEGSTSHPIEFLRMHRLLP